MHASARKELPTGRCARYATEEKCQQTRPTWLHCGDGNRSEPRRFRRPLVPRTAAESPDHGESSYGASAIIIETMNRRFFHGTSKPAEVAQALLAEFNDTNLRAQALGSQDNVIVQVATRPTSMSGGQTALTITLHSVTDGIMVELGEQQWLGIAASLGRTALSALRNPVSLLGRLDDLAQDIQSIQLTERVWQAIKRWASGTGAGMQLTERLSRVSCDYCGVANAVGEAACLACGAPMGRLQPMACPNCGWAMETSTRTCPNCGHSFLP